jgi:hypothetical protein
MTSLAVALALTLFGSYRLLGFGNKKAAQLLLGGFFVRLDCFLRLHHRKMPDVNAASPESRLAIGEVEAPELAEAFVKA